MPIIIIIIGGLILRSIAPMLFYILGVAFLAFLVFTAYAGIKEKDYGWKEALFTVVYIIITLWMMMG